MRLGTVRLRHSTRVSHLAFSPDNRHLVSVATENRLHIWDAATGELGYDARVYGVLDSEVLFMHLHRARAGDIGPVTVMLSRAGDARRSGTVVLTRSQRIAFEAGELYFDAHTRDHLTGLVRAQIGAPRRHDAP